MDSGDSKAVQESELPKGILGVQITRKVPGKLPDLMPSQEQDQPGNLDGGTGSPAGEEVKRL